MMHIVCPPPVTGAGHVSNRSACQDRVASDSGTVLGHSFTILGVADGAGSKQYSHYGAQTVLSTAVQELSNLRFLTELLKSVQRPNFLSRLFRIKTADELWPDIASNLVLKMRANLELQAAGLGVAVNQLSTTCIVALMVDDVLLAMRIGDGNLALRRRTGEIAAAFPPKTNAYLNETTFVLSETTPEIFFQHGVDGVLLATDGVEPFFFNLMNGEVQKENVDAFLKVTKKADALEQVTAWLNDPALKENTHDDLSLVIATWDK